MAYDPYNTNNTENPYYNNTDNTGDINYATTPDNVSNTNNTSHFNNTDDISKTNQTSPFNSPDLSQSVQYAKYGEQIYQNQQTPPQSTVSQPHQPAGPAGATRPTGTTGYYPYSSQYNANNYSAPVSHNPYSNNNTAKKKKEKSTVTRSTLALMLGACVLCSTILGSVGGYLISKSNTPKVTTTTSGNLTINKSDGDSPAHKNEGASLTTREIVDIAADSVVEITTEMVVTSAFSQQYIQEGAGSGVIISADGYIVTNHHVIDGASDVSVTLRGQENSIRAEIIGTYQAGDIALLKIDPPAELTSATFGNSDNLNVGDYAVAIGNPLGQLGGTVTDGIISALDREVDIDGQNMNLLQTNAEISPGNSGGGLFNGNGELIGIVNAKSSTAEAEGLGFAIPINDVQDVLSDLKKYGYVKGQIDLGMTLKDISSTAEAWLYGASQGGVYVAGVNSGSNAEAAGFYSGDIILKVNGTEVKTTAEVDTIIDKLKVGDTVSFEVLRNGTTGTLKMQLQEYNENAPQQSVQDDNSPSIWDYFGY